MMNIIFETSPIMSIAITFVAYIIAHTIYRFIKISFLHPLVIAVFLVGISIYFLKVPYETYNQNGGKFFTAMIAPATVTLALPIYRNMAILKANAGIILVSISLGVFLGCITTFLLCKAFAVDSKIMASLLSKSVTTAISVELSESMGGLRSIAILAVMVSGIIGALTGPFICKILKIKSPIAVGLAMGTASHAIGTSRALEMGETEGAMSGLAIGVAGALTVIFLPILYSMLKIIF